MMKHRLLFPSLALGLLLAFAGTSFAAGLETMTYPDLRKLVAESKGKVVVVNFFASWCQPCREEVPGLVNIRKSYGEDKLVLIGASIDEDEQALKKYMGEAGFNYPIVRSGADLAMAAGVRGIPHMLIFDAKGELAANEAGFVPEDMLRRFLDKIMEL